MPADVEAWLQSSLGVKASKAKVEWRDDELSLAMPRPGGDSLVRIDARTGNLDYQTTDRGVIALLNDLHKGRYAGPVWSWFIDLFAGASLLSALTGLLILMRQSAAKAAVWPLVGLGAAIPAALALLIMH